MVATWVRVGWSAFHFGPWRRSGADETDGPRGKTERGESNCQARLEAPYSLTGVIKPNPQHAWTSGMRKAPQSPGMYVSQAHTALEVNESLKYSCAASPAYRQFVPFVWHLWIPEGDTMRYFPCIVPGATWTIRLIV